MASKQPRSYQTHWVGTRNSVQEPSFASGMYEILLETASGCTSLLYDFAQKIQSRHIKRADMSSAAPALATDITPDDLSAVSSVAENDRR